MALLDILHKIQAEAQVKTLEDTLSYVQTEPLHDTLRDALLEPKAKRLGDAFCDVQAKLQVVTLAKTPLEKSLTVWHTLGDASGKNTNQYFC